MICERLLDVAPLRAIALGRHDRLRQQPDVADDRNARGDDRAHSRDHLAGTLELHRVAAGLVDEPTRRGDGDGVARFVAAEREIADERDALARRGARRA